MFRFDEENNRLYGKNITIMIQKGVAVMASEHIVLNQGQNTNLAQGHSLNVTIQCESSPSPLDISCFMVDEAGKVPSDDYFIFYNQNVDPHQSVQCAQSTERSTQFTLDMDKLQSVPVAKCVFTATLEGAGTFAEVQGCQAVLHIGEQEITYTITEATAETALIFIEVYRYQQGFKVRAIGRGFFGGLKPLAESFGVEIDDSPEETVDVPTSSVETTPAPVSSEPTPESVTPPSNPSLGKIDLLKRKVTLSLEKKQIPPIQARVAVVFDASGSMYSLYKKGIVQEAFERILAIATAFDDNGELDVWFFAKEFLRAPSVRAEDYKDYVARTYKLGSKGGTNNEPPVMEDVIRKYTVEEPNVRIPTYIIFFSDGGVSSKSKITKLITDSSHQNLFWQFVGLGNANYGILRQLDELKGRFIDNASFFELDDISKVSDEELYDRLLSEFPSWIVEARRKGILA